MNRHNDDHAAEAGRCGPDDGWRMVDPHAPGGLRELTAAERAAVADRIRATAPDCRPDAEGASRTAWVDGVERDDSDQWFSSGLDDAHQDYLDDLGHVHTDDDPGRRGDPAGEDTAAAVDRAHQAVADLPAWPAGAARPHPRPDRSGDRDEFGEQTAREERPLEQGHTVGEPDEWGESR